MRTGRNCLRKTGACCWIFGFKRMVGELHAEVVKSFSLPVFQKDSFTNLPVLVDKDFQKLQILVDITINFW